ncbi:MAG: RNA polymerase sigma factor, partial [bacterium]
KDEEELWEEKEAVWEAVACLEAELREVVICRLQEYSWKEIAKILGCPEGTVRWRFSKAKESLKKILDDWEIF